MAAGFLSAPGTEFGPCADACEHRDCAATRARAASACLACGEPIGYDRDFFNTYDDATDAFLGCEHATCTYKRLDA